MIAEGEGVVVRDVERKEFLDFSGGIGVLNVGHCPAEVVKAIRDQAGKYLHTCFMVQMYEPYVALAKALNDLFPVKYPKRTLFLNSGAEAVESGGLSGTFGGNPVSCRAGLEVIKLLQEKNWANGRRSSGKKSWIGFVPSRRNFRSSEKFGVSGR
jgi:4-aminobutyrate aminotransferase-like enzyme